MFAVERVMLVALLIETIVVPAGMPRPTTPMPTERPALLVTVSVPSDIAGYFFGLVKYPAGVYLSALAIGEIPYGLAAVFLTDAFLQRKLSLLLILAGVAGLAGFWAWRRHGGRSTPETQATEAERRGL